MKKTFDIFYAFKEYIVPLVVFIFILGMIYASAFAEIKQIPEIKEVAVKNKERIVVLEQQYLSIKDTQEKSYALLLKVYDKIETKQDKK